MKNLRWICAGALVGLAGVVALSISAAPCRPTAGSVAAWKAAPAVPAVPAVPAAPAADLGSGITAMTPGEPISPPRLLALLRMRR